MMATKLYPPEGQFPYPEQASSLPTDATARKEVPLVRGLLDYFPDALADVAHVSFIGNQQHNPGQEMHWARGKSTDEADSLVRHLMQRGNRDTDGIRHTAKVAWRALALLQKEIEAELGLPVSRGSLPAFPELPTQLTIDRSSMDVSQSKQPSTNSNGYGHVTK